MFLIKIPSTYADQAKIENPFKDLSLAYKIESDASIDEPQVIEGKKTHQGEQSILQLIEELQGYYGTHYNCSCAR